MSIEDAVNEFCEKELGVTFDNVIGCDGDDIFSAFQAGTKLAKSELSALREQLDTMTASALSIRDEWRKDQQRLTAAEIELALKDAVIEDMLESNGDMVQLLTSAEQRNLELVAILKMVESNGGAMEEYEWDRIQAALKPAEPARCSNCDRATVEQCDDAGCGFLGAGNGAPTETQPTESRASE